MIKTIRDEDLVIIYSGKETDNKVIYWTTLYYYKGLVIDSGCPASSNEVFRYLTRLGDIKAVLLTHDHEDHIGGAATLWEAGIKIYAPKNSINKLSQPMKLPKYRAMVWGVPKPFKATPSLNKMVFNDIEVKSVKIQGHGTDHLVYNINDMMFIGDLIGSRKPMIGYIKEDYSQIIKSIEKILEYDFKVAYGGHVILLYDEVCEVLNYLKLLRRKSLDLLKKGYKIYDVVNELLGNVPEKVIWMEKLSEGEWKRRYLIETIIR